MKISEVISGIKSYCKGMTEWGKPASDTRDCILNGSNFDQECTGIAVTSFVTIDVVRKAKMQNINLIITHEGQFYNSGDPKWLEGNHVYDEKKKVFEESNIVIWRCCDYMTSGIPVNGNWVDGTAYGFAAEMGWEKNILPESMENECQGFYVKYDFSDQNMTVEDLCNEMIDKGSLNGLALCGSKDAPAKKVWYLRHQLLGMPDQKVIEDMYSEHVDVIICGDMTEYTVSEYVRDAKMAGRDSALIHYGNFNMYDLAMRYGKVWIKNALGSDTPKVEWIPAGDCVSEYL